MGLIIWLVIGAIAGWLAGLIMNQKGNLKIPGARALQDGEASGSA